MASFMPEGTFMAKRKDGDDNDVDDNWFPFDIGGDTCLVVDLGRIAFNNYRERREKIYAL